MATEQQEQPTSVNANRFVGFSQNQVTILTDNDFTVEERVEIFLKEKSGCAIILFHGNNDESAQLSLVFAAVASQAEVRDFYAVNLSYNRKLAKAMTNLLTGNTPLRWMGLKQLPFIAIYQNGQPVGAYNGSRTVRALVDFSMTRACSQNFSEPIQVFNSVRSDINFGIPGVSESPVPNTSVEFTDATELRPLSAADTTGTTAADTTGTTASL